MSAKTPSVPFGKRVPDLVLVMDQDKDRGKVLEFRVQCEVVLNDDEAKAIFEALYAAEAKAGGVTAAHQKVKVVLAHGDHSNRFKRMVDLAFKDHGSKEPIEGDAP